MAPWLSWPVPTGTVCGVVLQTGTVAGGAALPRLRKCTVGSTPDSITSPGPHPCPWGAPHPPRADTDTHDHTQQILPSSGEKAGSNTGRHLVDFKSLAPLSSPHTELWTAGPRRAQPSLSDPGCPRGTGPQLRGACFHPPYLKVSETNASFKLCRHGMWQSFFPSKGSQKI